MTLFVQEHLIISASREFVTQELERGMAALVESARQRITQNQAQNARRLSQVHHCKLNIFDI